MDRPATTRIETHLAGRGSDLLRCSSWDHHQGRNCGSHQNQQMLTAPFHHTILLRVRCYMPDPVAGGRVLYMSLTSEYRPFVTILTNAFSSVQAASRTVFHRWPVSQLAMCSFRCLGLPRVHRKRGSGSKCTNVGNRIVLDPGASMHSPRPRTVSGLEGREEGGVAWCKIGPKDAHETSRRY